MTDNDDDLNLAICLSLSECDAKNDVTGGGRMTEQEKAWFTSEPFQPRGGKGSPVRTGGFSPGGSFLKPTSKPPPGLGRRDVPQVDDDYALAKALQEEEESVVSQTKKQEPQRSSSGSKDGSQPPSLFPKLFPDPSKCAGCGWPFINGRIMLYEGRKYHDGCFKCTHCRGPISGGFVLHGSPTPTPYHQHCADKLFSLFCSLCTTKIQGEYLRHPFFSENCYCKSHHDRKSCFSCARKEPLLSSGKEGFSDLPDGRSLCMDCARTAIIDSTEAKPLYDSVVDFMEFVLKLPIPPGMRSVPVLAVDLPSLNEQRGNTTKVYHSARGGTGSITRGLTLKECGSVQQYGPGSIYWDGEQWVSSGPRVYRTEEVRAATAVLVLFGLPSDLTASILAHEAMHVWCSLTKDFPFILPPHVEEGICQLISYKYMEYIRTTDSGVPLSRSSSRPTGGSETSWDAKLRAYISNQILTDPSEEYGEGFRTAAQCSDILGIQVLLDFIKESKEFPRIT